MVVHVECFFFSSRRRHTRFKCDWSSDVCSSDLGLRFSEATRLALADVDLTEAVLTIRATKFYKSRLAPVGPQLAEGLESYMPWRLRGNLERGQDSYLLSNRDAPRLRSSAAHAPS